MKNTFKFKMILAFTVLSSSMLIIFAILNYIYSTQLFKKQSYDYCQIIVQENIKLVERYFLQIALNSHMISTDSSVVDIVRSRNGNDPIEPIEELHNTWLIKDKISQLGFVGNIGSITIIGKDGTSMYYSGKAIKKDFVFYNQQWFQEILKQPIATAKFTSFHDKDYLINDDGQQVISYIAPINDITNLYPAKPYFLMCDINIENIMLDHTNRSEITIAIQDINNAHYSSRTYDFSADQVTYFNKKLDEGSHRFIVETTRSNPISYLVVVENSQLTGLSMLGIKPLSEITDYRHKTVWFIIIVVSLTFICILIISLYVSNSILIPLNMIKGKFMTIAQGNFDIAFEKTKSEEVNMLTETASYMIHNIIDLKDQVIEDQQLIAESNLKMLQHQINPHFLNNVLHSIKALSVCGDIEGVSAATTLLGKILKYSIYNPYNTVSIKDELSYVDNYLELQSIRFKEWFTYTLWCDDHLEEIPIPKLIIQPIVENAVEHGFSHEHRGQITINVIQEIDDILIIIRDSGIGMTAEKLNLTRKLLQDKQAFTVEKSIGLLNVNERLQRLYGPDYGVHIVTSEYGKTIVTINLPYNRSGR